MNVKPYNDGTGDCIGMEPVRVSKRQRILDALYAFAAQRAGMEPGNYGSWRDYRNESASVTRDLHDARTLLRAVELSSLPVEGLREAFRAFSGRLTLEERGSGFALSYCTGQYFPTEYRKAVCAVCSSALWDWYRDDFAAAAKAGESRGDAIRRNFRRMFGARLARRYFS